MTPLVVPSPAKLNLFLHITGKRPDGYHDLQTVFQLIDLEDTLHFTPTEDDNFHITSNVNDIPMAEHLCYRAWVLMRPHCASNPGMHIHLEKRIPLGAGMGGGSSNAATTLLALNHLWKTKLSHEQLMAYALQLGADVPVFVQGQNAFAEGVGEKLTPIDLPHRWFVLAFPHVHANTGSLFSHPHLTRNSKPITIADYRAGVNTENVFTPLVCEQYPDVANALALLNAFGQARMTGSGSTVFLAVETFAQAQDIVGHIGSQLITYVAQSLSESSLLASLQTGPV